MSELQNRDPLVRGLTAALAAPFNPKDVKFKPQLVKGNRCLAMAYIDARLIQDRLDDVLGPENWEDDYKLLPDGSVMCKLKIKLGDRWVRKCDVGSPSEQPDGGDRLKAACSDSLKRAAVKFGIGRYLYRLSAQWVDYDPVKKQIVQVPQLPPFAIPKATTQAQTQKKHDPQPAKTGVATVATMSDAEKKAAKESLDVIEKARREKNQKDIKEFWVLMSDPSLSDMNDALPKLKTMNEEAKNACWEKTQEVARKKGWKFNAATIKYEHSNNTTKG